MKTVLKVIDVCKRYEKAEQPSLNHVSFEIPEGEFVGIMGASGSGKTTLLNVLSTIDKPTQGDIFINQINLKSLAGGACADFRRDHLGFIFQEYFLLDSLTIRENIAVPLTLLKQKPEKIERAVSGLAQRFGIEAQLDKYPCELSGGQRQRASAARALVKQPSILFADEPTGALDSGSAAGLLDALLQANRELRTTILMVTHDAYAASFADRIFIFKDGGITRELRRNGGTKRSFYEEIMKTIQQEAQL